MLYLNYYESSPHSYEKKHDHFLWTVPFSRYCPFHDSIPLFSVHIHWGTLGNNETGGCIIILPRYFFRGIRRGPTTVHSDQLYHQPSSFVMLNTISNEYNDTMKYAIDIQWNTILTKNFVLISTTVPFAISFQQLNICALLQRNIRWTLYF